MIIRGPQRFSRSRTDMMEDIPSVSDVAGHPPWPPPPPLGSRCETTPLHTNPNAGTRNASRRISRSQPILPEQMAGMDVLEENPEEENLTEMERMRDRVKILEENIRYLKSEHSKLLEGLHDEVDSLKRLNKVQQAELQYCMTVMQQQDEQLKRTTGHTAGPNGTAGPIAAGLIAAGPLAAGPATQQLYSESASCVVEEQTEVSFRDSASQRAESPPDDPAPVPSRVSMTEGVTSHMIEGLNNNNNNNNNNYNNNMVVQKMVPSETMVSDMTEREREENDLKTSIKCQAMERLAELRTLFYEQEMRKAKRELEIERHNNQLLVEQLHTVQKQVAQRLNAALNGSDNAATRSSNSQNTFQTSGISNSIPGGSTSYCCGPPHVGIPLPQLPFNATLDPLLVHRPPQRPRPPTLNECQVIVRHLQTLVNRQAHELSQLKSDLRDVLYSHSWTPDAFLLARAYISEDDQKLSSQSHSRVPMNHPTKKLPDIVYDSKDYGGGVLPSIHPVVSGQSVDRHKRVQLLHNIKSYNKIK